VWYPDRNSARGPCEYGEVARTAEGDDDGTEEGSGISGGSGMAFESPFGGGVRFSFCGGDFLGCRILYLDFPLPDVVVGDTGTGTGVAVLDVSVEPDNEEGTLMEDMESGSNGILGFPSDFASSCAFANLNFAVRGVSVFSLDSLDEDWAGDDGRERDCDRERDGERAGVEGVCER
jgi:hypothetical protein